MLSARTLKRCFTSTERLENYANPLMGRQFQQEDFRQLNSSIAYLKPTMAEITTTKQSTRSGAVSCGCPTPRGLKPSSPPSRWLAMTSELFGASSTTVRSWSNMCPALNIRQFVQSSFHGSTKAVPRGVMALRSKSAANNPVKSDKSMSSCLLQKAQKSRQHTFAPYQGR